MFKFWLERLNWPERLTVFHETFHEPINLYRRYVHRDDNVYGEDGRLQPDQEELWEAASDWWERFLDQDETVKKRMWVHLKTFDQIELYRL